MRVRTENGKWGPVPEAFEGRIGGERKERIKWNSEVCLQTRAVVPMLEMAVLRKETSGGGWLLHAV